MILKIATIILPPLLAMNEEDFSKQKPHAPIPIVLEELIYSALDHEKTYTVTSHELGPNKKLLFKKGIFIVEKGEEDLLKLVCDTFKFTAGFNVAFKGYTEEKPIDPIDVSSVLKEERVFFIPTASLLTVHHLSFKDLPSSQFAQLGFFKHLKVLKVDGMYIPDIKAIENCTLLTKLTLKNLGIEDISPISSLVGLIELDLSGNRITEISSLSKLFSLQKLILRSNGIEDTSPLSHLTGLKKLYLSYNKISNIDSLFLLKNLEELSLRPSIFTFIDDKSLSKLPQNFSYSYIGPCEEIVLCKTPPKEEDL